MSPAELKSVKTEVTDPEKEIIAPKTTPDELQTTETSNDAASKDAPAVSAEKQSASRDEAAKPSTTKKGKAQQRPRVTRADRIKSQANPQTLLSGKQKTMLLQLSYTSDIMHEYLLMNQRTMLSAYERLAALLRMVAREKDLLTHVNEWVHTNTEIAQAQIDTLEAQYVELEMKHIDGNDVDMPQMNIPDTYNTTFEASHPVAHKMIAIAKKVDEALQKLENLFFAGILDDAQYNAMQTQANSIIRGSVDRIFKATTPGTRQGGRYQPAQLARWLREGNRLMFADVPQDAAHLVEEAA